MNLKNDSAILKVKTKKFSSERNSLAYFNANNSIGVGVGTGSVYTFEVGGTPKTVAIPPRQIYIQIIHLKQDKNLHLQNHLILQLLQ